MSRIVNKEEHERLSKKARAVLVAMYHTDLQDETALYRAVARTTVQEVIKFQKAGGDPESAKTLADYFINIIGA